MNRLIVLAILTCVCTCAQAAVRLKADATGLNDGTSWANAFTNAHDAVAAAIEGDGVVYAADAFGADRKAHSALGPLNTDPLGLLMLVR